MSTPPKDHKIKRPYGPWVPSNETDVRKTFECIRKEIAADHLRKVVALKKGQR